MLYLVDSRTVVILSSDNRESWSEAFRGLHSFELKRDREAFTICVEEDILLKIRLTLMGSKKKPKYRIVVMEKSRARDGRYIDVLGQYDPKRNPASVNLDKEKYAYWIAKGAQPSDTVKSFFKKAG